MSRTTFRPREHMRRWFSRHGYDCQSPRESALKLALDEAELEAIVDHDGDEFTPHIRPNGRTRWFKVIRAMDDRAADAGMFLRTELFTRRAVRSMPMPSRIARSLRRRVAIFEQQTSQFRFKFFLATPSGWVSLSSRR